MFRPVIVGAQPPCLPVLNRMFSCAADAKHIPSLLDFIYQIRYHRSMTIDRSRDVIEAAVLFADLAGFTAMTEAHGDLRAADVAERFAALVSSQLGPGDRLIKSIGDAVLVSSPSAATGVALLHRIARACAAAEHLPAVRMGAHFGPIVERGDDIFGATVDLAARITAAAAGGQVLAGPALAGAARTAGISVTDLGPRTFCNVTAPLRVVDLELGAHLDCTAIDPVCHVQVRDAAPAVRLQHRGAGYQFCSLDCAAAFLTDSDRFATTVSRSTCRHRPDGIPANSDNIAL